MSWALLYRWAYGLLSGPLMLFTAHPKRQHNELGEEIYLIYFKFLILKKMQKTKRSSYCQFNDNNNNKYTQKGKKYNNNNNEYV